MTTMPIPQSMASTPKSSFSQACNLLSQYLKEKRSVEEPAGIIATTRIQGITKTTTMDLFPQKAGLFCSEPAAGAAADSICKPAPQAATETASLMTVFYGGRVQVFDGITKEHAQAIMETAGGTGQIIGSKKSKCAKEDAAASGLPIKRRGSLQRFFEKRKDRIAARAAPYSCGKGDSRAVSRSPMSSSWLGLGLIRVADEGLQS